MGSKCGESRKDVVVCAAGARGGGGGGGAGGGARGRRTGLMEERAGAAGQLTAS